ncbi:NADH oxidase [Desulfomarina profundi]|uniref:NADH oxidase n=1 Tax=Desulfomarina profundi TaxID=2772557 RepID=A0A8D5JMR4_9BACT|nr:FAD-dependent oxidoreductase [Desulfomarina profundi]BCL61882.1 NADH oxidase [Desulfomarina profundi]
MKQIDVLVIGGSAAGIVAATTARSFYPDRKVMLIRKEEKVLVPCGIPYMFGTLGGSEKNVVPDQVLSGAGVDLVVGEAVSIDQEKKTCSLADGSVLQFEKLVLATGSTPVQPGWLPGTDLENVFFIPKNKEYLDNQSIEFESCNKVVVIGGGFIGVEMADELVKAGKDVTIVELLPHVLSLAFDEELAMKAEEALRKRGVKIVSGRKVQKIVGDGKVSAVLLDDGETLDADAVILSVGYQPNSELAKNAGLGVNDLGFIRVNEYMRTENPDIFAVGDCAEKFSFITRTPKRTMLASTSCAEARIAGMNLYKLSTVRSFTGTLSIFCTAIGDEAFGAAGVTENLANERGFEVVTGLFEGIDRHPGSLPDTHVQIVKLIASVDSGIILGGEVYGGSSVGELTNLIGFIIQNRMTVDAVLTSQIGTHPLLTAPPTAYPLIKAAESIARKRIG